MHNTDGQEKLERIKKCNDNEVQKEKINILFVGRFDKQKGYDYLLNVIKVADVSKYTFNIIGDSVHDVFEKIEKENMSSTRKKYILSIIDTRYNMIFGCFVGFKKNNKDWMLEKFDREMLTRYPHITNSVNLYNKKCIRWNYHAMLPILRFFKKTFLLCKKQ